MAKETYTCTVRIPEGRCWVSVSSSVAGSVMTWKWDRMAATCVCAWLCEEKEGGGGGREGRRGGVCAFTPVDACIVCVTRAHTHTETHGHTQNHGCDEGSRGAESGLAHVGGVL